MSIKEKFQTLFQEEFDDPNESFQDFLFSLIPASNLLKIINNQKYQKKENGRCKCKKERKTCSSK